MKDKLTRIALLAILLFSFATHMFAGAVNCSVTPGNSACQPSIFLTYQVGNGPTSPLSAVSAPTYSNGAWKVDFIPQVFPQFLWTGGQVVTTPDPFVGFSFGVINHSNSVMTYNYDFQTPYAGGPYYRIQSIFGDVLIDTNFKGTSAVHPVNSPYVMNTWVSGNLVSALGLGLGCTTPANVFVCTSPDIGAIGPLVYVSPATGILEVKGSFSVTPGGQYTLTGRSEIPIPEPGTLALLGSGIMGLGSWLRRRL